MKKSTKILSVFLALLMAVSCIPLTAFAADRDTSSLDAYLSNDNLANVAETLLTDLGDRKEEIVPTILSLVCQFVPEIKAKLETGVYDASAEQMAKAVIDFADEALTKADLNQYVKDYASLVKLIGISKLDLSSVDTILQVLVDVGGLVGGKKSTWGDLANLDVSPLETKKGTAKTTGNSSNLDVIYGLFDFLSASKNVALIKTVVKGNLSLGSMNGTIKTFAKIDAAATVNDLMKNLDTTIKELLYNSLLAEKETVTNEDGTTSEKIKVAYADSAYAKFSSDELLAAALIKLINKQEVTQDEANKATGMTLYELIATYADVAIANYAIDPLNTTVKDALKKAIDGDTTGQLAVLKNVLNLDYNFTAETFNFAGMASTGLFENLNNLVCRVIKTMTTSEAYAAMGLKEGDNKNITANLTSFFSYVLTTLSANNGGKLEFTIDGKPYTYDFSQFTAANIAGKSLEDMAVAVLKLFFPGWFGEEAPADADSLEKLGAYAANKAITKWMPADFAFTGDYKALVYNADGTMKTLSQSQWFDIIGTMGMDVACYWLNKANINFNMTAADAKAFKAQNWTWEDFFEYIVDWALNYIKGIPAVADELEMDVATKDGYGAWYKLNVVLNELLPLSFINGCGDETFTVDTYTFVFEKAAPSIADCDFAAFADILSMNKESDNPFNSPVISATLKTVDSLLFAIFEHTCGTSANFTKAATAKHDGYTGTYDTANGHYIDVTVTPATGETTEPPTEKPTEPPTEKPSEPTTENPTEPSNDVLKGDVDGNGRVTASDARLALRISATLETATADNLKAGDLNGDGVIKSSEARTILRVSASLESF